MVEKLDKYEGIYGRISRAKGWVKEKVEEWKEEESGGLRKMAMDALRRNSENQTLHDFPHIYRRKTTSELIRASAAVMGIEFSYAAETAFVSPTLLKIGVEHKLMTMVWGLSPLLGFFVTPVLGSLSDGCSLSMGRRRPFILLLSIGVLIGLILVPNGEDIGHALGDFYPSKDLINYSVPLFSKNLVSAKMVNHTDHGLSDSHYPHPWGIFFTVLGTVLLDFDADSCQSPARAYLLDVSVSEDHARGLSTFTIMAGLGGFFGYSLGGIDWDATFPFKILDAVTAVCIPTAIVALLLGLCEYLGGHVRAVFTFITVLFIFCVLITITAFKEIPLNILLKEQERHQKMLLGDKDFEGIKIKTTEAMTYGATNTYQLENSSTEEKTAITEKENELTRTNSKVLEASAEIPSLKEYLLSIAFMPKSMRIICLTNLFCWMSHVCYSLYFTDFVGEAVFNGDPSAPIHSPEYEKYQEGVRFGCWGMAMYSLSCSCYSLLIEKLIKKFRARKVYFGGLLFYSIGMMLLAITKNKVGVILFSWTAGVMYSTLFTLPYLLVAHYHANGVFEVTKEGEVKLETRQRGLGTDVGIVSSMVFLAQFILAISMGSIVNWAGTTTAVVSVASFLAFCGALSSTKIMYLDL